MKVPTRSEKVIALCKEAVEVLDDAKKPEKTGADRARAMKRARSLMTLAERIERAP